MKIDLAMKNQMGTEPVSDKPYYPTLHIETDEKIDFPHAGTITLHYKKTSSSMNEREGKKHYSCTLEMQEILDMEGDKEEDTRTTSRKTEDALDKIADEYGKKNRKGDY